MALPFLPALLLAVLVQDPQALYRDALFEEIDQSNAAKALDLYSSILKSEAKPALKAKALFRQGCCLQQLKRQDEAERTFREVTERYRDEKETARLAAARLFQAPSDGGLAGETDRLILDLGASNQPVAAAAARRLVLLGEPSIPALTRALSHKDPTLRAWAASCLLALERYEGLYGALMSALVPGRNGHADASSTLGFLLARRPEDRERFIRDFAAVDMEAAREMTFIRDLNEPRLRPACEELLLKSALSDSELILGAWCQIVAPAEITPFLKRIPPGESVLYNVERILKYLWNFERHQVPNPALDRFLRDFLLQRDPLAEVVVKSRDGGDMYTFSTSFMLFLSPASIRDVFASWIRHDDPGVIQAALGANHWVSEGRSVRPEVVGVLLASLAASRPESHKELIVRALRDVALPESQRAAIHDFQLALLKKAAALEAPGEERLQEILNITDSLVRQLPADSNLLDPVLRIAVLGELNFRFFEQRYGGDYDFASKRPWIRERSLKIALEGLAAVKSSRPDARFSLLMVIERFGEPVDYLVLKSVLSDFDGESFGGAVRILTAGFLGAPEADRKVFIKELPALLAKLPEVRRGALLQGVANDNDPLLDPILLEAFTSPEVQMRACAVNRWARQKRKADVPNLVRALGDPAPSIQLAAMQGLGEETPVETVPVLIGLLDSTSEHVRDRALALLESIKAFQERKLQWRRWYDEVKGQQPK